MVYMGGKTRIRKYIVPILQKEVTNAHGYYEPFCGGCNIIDSIQHPVRVAADKNRYLIEFWKNLSEKKLNSLPRELTREEYNKCRAQYRQGRIDWYIAAVGFLGSFGGRFYDGGYLNTSWTTRVNNVRAQIPKIKGVSFYYRDYLDTPKDLRNWVIYCDPPYVNTKGYVEKINYDQFWNWCEDMKKSGAIIYASEQKAPIGEEVWNKPVKRTMNSDNIVETIERLFRI